MRFQFGQFTLDAGRRELRKGAELVAVEPQVFDVLALLVGARDRVVSRDELLAVVWNGRIVSEATLSSRINAARAAIGDTGAAQALIRTLPRKGFRFVGDVTEAGAVSPPAPKDESTWQAPRLPALAVLPFANLSGDPGQDYFADGMTEEIISALSRVSGLFVIARNSSFTYKGRHADVRQIGRELGVGYVLEGSVRRGGDQLRITGQLVDAVSGATLWSDRFDGDMRDVFELQGRVSDSVAAVIEPTLERAEIGRRKADPPARADAYDLLLRAYGLFSDFTPASMDAALAALGQALAIDPDYAPALAALAYGRAQCHFQGWAKQDVRQDDAARADAVRLAWRAVEIAPNDAQVLWMSAFAIWNMDERDRMRARDLFARALLINPNSAMALVLSGWIETMCGNLDAGREMLEKAERLNPRDPRGWLMAGARAIVAVIEENYPEALRWAERALAQNRRFAVALRVAAVAQVKLGEQARAQKTVRELLAVEPELTVSKFFARIPVPLENMAKTYAEALAAAGLPR